MMNLLSLASILAALRQEGRKNMTTMWVKLNSDANRDNAFEWSRWAHDQLMGNDKSMTFALN